MYGVGGWSVGRSAIVAHVLNTRGLSLFDLWVLLGTMGFDCQRVTRNSPMDWVPQRILAVVTLSLIITKANGDLDGD